MPYNYLTIDENGSNTGLVSASYFDTELQSLYEQSYLTNEIFFGDSDDDLVEFSLYNSEQEPLAFNRIIPNVTYNVIQGDYLDINGQSKNYRILNPNTNILRFGDNMLLHPQFDLRFNEVSPGLYYLLYNPIRNIAGNTNTRLVIKEISPSRTELRLSFAFNKNISESNRLTSIKTSAFASKKYLFLQLGDNLKKIINNNPLSSNFYIRNQDFQSNIIKICQNLGFKSEADLLQFIIDSYTGFDKVLVLNRNENTDVLSYQSVKFTGIADQLKNFIYQYNDLEFSADEIQLAIKTIVTKISQDRIVQKTSLNPIDLQDAVDFFVQVIYEDWLQPQTSDLLTNYSIRFFGLYKNALNFDNGNLVKILSHTSYFNSIEGVNNVQIKLDSPLPTEYNLKTTCWISNISIAPLYFKVNMYADSVSRKVYLNGVNFSVKVPTIAASNDTFSNIDQNSLFYAKSRLKQKINDLLIDYNDFNNFINYSSAELRTKIAKNKIIQYVGLDTSKEQVSTRASNSSPSISSSLSERFNVLTQDQINILNTFDEYESYLFFNTSSIDDKIQEGISYDKDNYDSLLNQLPAYLKNDPQSEDYIKFTSMVGHFFDNILVYIKKFPRAYPISYNDSNDYPKNYIEELLNSFNWNLDNVKFEKSDIRQLLFNNTEYTGSLSSSYFDYAKSILNRFTNNLSGVYKTKGTGTSYELIRSIFGVSSDLIQPVEYGSSDVFVNRQVFYDFDDIVYMSKFTNNEYIKFNYTGSEFKLVPSGNAYSQSASTGITQSFREVFTGLSALELSFKFKIKNYDFLDRIPLIKKQRNGTDWQIYVKKSIQKESGQLIFNFQPYESNEAINIVLPELPLLNGDVYTLLLSRELAPIAFDIPETIINSSALTQSITSSTAEKYAPYVYTLAVNQYYGSQLNFTAKKTSTVLYEYNQFFSSGSYHVGNFLTTTKFVGNIDKIKVYLDPISQDNFNEHSYNINSFSIDDKSREYENARYVWSFDTPISLYTTASGKLVPNQNPYYKDFFTAVNFPAQIKNVGYPVCKPMEVTDFPYQFEKLSLKQTINSNKFGPNYRNNSKINKIDLKLDTNLVPSEESAYTTDVLGADSNVIGYYITPYNYLNTKIEDFLGKDGIANIIGDPAYLTQQSYPELKVLQREFAALNEKYIYPQEFLSTYNFYIDFSIFDFIKKITPQRATLKRGILLEPSVFERQKFNYRNVEVTALNPDNALVSSSSLITFNNYATLTSSLTNTESTSSYGVLRLLETNDIDIDHDQYNYSMFEIPSEFDPRDFVYSKYGKDVGIDNDGPYIKDLAKVNDNQYYLMTNNRLPSLVAFSSSFYRVTQIGSGSITGSSIYKDLYKGDLNSGYSKRHLSKFVFAGSRTKYRAVSGSIYKIINGVKLDKNASLTYYTFTKGKNDYTRTVNRSGLPNGSSPIITIPGYLSLQVTSSTFTKYGKLTGSISSPQSIFVQQPLTASIYTSSSLDTYIMNL